MWLPNSRWRSVHIWRCKSLVRNDGGLHATLKVRDPLPERAQGCPFSDSTESHYAPPSCGSRCNACLDGQLVWPGDCPTFGRTMALAHIATTTAICQPLCSPSCSLEPLRLEAAKDTLKVDRILLPVDFTERSIGAARCAADLAQRFGAKVTLLHVVPTARRKSCDFAGEHDPLTLGHSTIQLAVAELLQAVPFRRLTVTGDPASRIVEHARQEGAGLILMPTRGRRRWSGVLDDSITARVIRRAHCPVWTSAGDNSKPLRIGHVLWRSARGAAEFSSGRHSWRIISKLT